MGNLLKVVFLGVAGFALLVFLTAEKPKQMLANDNVVKITKYDSIPSEYELVGKDDKVKRETLFKKDQDTLIVVGNHDSLAVVKELPTMFSIDLPYVMVANISSAPWFVKKMFIPGKLEDLNEGTNIPMIYDFDGDMVNALYVTDNAKTKYAAFILSKEGTITKIYEGSVKEGALDGSMTKEEIKTALKPLYELIKK